MITRLTGCNKEAMDKAFEANLENFLKDEDYIYELFCDGDGNMNMATAIGMMFGGMYGVPTEVLSTKINKESSSEKVVKMFDMVFNAMNQFYESEDLEYTKFNKEN